MLRETMSQSCVHPSGTYMGYRASLLFRCYCCCHIGLWGIRVYHARVSRIAKCRGRRGKYRRKSLGTTSGRTVETAGESYRMAVRPVPYMICTRWNASLPEHRISNDLCACRRCCGVAARQDDKMTPRRILQCQNSPNRVTL